MMTEEGLRLSFIAFVSACSLDRPSPAVAVHRQQARLAQQVVQLSVSTRRDRAVVGEHDLGAARHRALAGHVHRRRLQLGHEDVVLPCCLEVLVQTLPIREAGAEPDHPASVEPLQVLRLLGKLLPVVPWW